VLQGADFTRRHTVGSTTINAMQPSERCANKERREPRCVGQSLDPLRPFSIDDLPPRLNYGAVNVNMKFPNPKSACWGALNGWPDLVAKSRTLRW